ncbi:hypothetical protein CDAR_45141 [Caerostris darwini]|uniref:Uncharacterized protein n=1 Tax=Caerostris darwini TaxID=1538125 RepID=A0AAV4W8Y0_9ARAC|nr:hypothetical protein CDAR_45141 [Caerostris darwini]
MSIFKGCRTQISYPLPREAYSSADPAAQSTARWTTFEDVVQRLEEAEKSVMMLTEQTQVLREAQEKWRVERNELIKVQSEEI